MCTIRMPGSQLRQKMSDHLELELGMVFRYHLSLGTRVKSSVRATMAAKCQFSSSGQERGADNVLISFVGEALLHGNFK